MRGLWEPHAQAAAEGLGVEGLRALAIPILLLSPALLAARFLGGEGSPGFALVAAEV